MQRTLTSQLQTKVGQNVLLKGWINNIRVQGKIIFIDLRDIDGIVQVVVESSNSNFNEIKTLNLESVISVEGLVQKLNNTHEILVKRLEIINKNALELPIPILNKTGNETELDKRLDWRWLDLRKPNHALIFKIWTDMEMYFREFWISSGFIEIHSPKLIGSSSESGSELFKMKYFDREACLAQSPQTYKQMAMAAGFEKVFEIGPVFRANPSFTARHDTEFTMYDMEMSFINDHYDVMNFEEQLLKYVFDKLHTKYYDQIKNVFGVEIRKIDYDIPKISMIKVKEILQSKNIASKEEGDLSPEEERGLCEYILETTGSEFVFVTEYATAARAFYSMRCDDPKWCKSFDLLYKGIEITSGAQREHRAEQFKLQIEEKGFNSDEFESYINFFRYGCPPHGGLAVGPTRLLMRILGINNVREVTYIYRGPNRLTP